MWVIEYFLLLENFFRLRVDDILYTFVLGKTNSFKKLNIQSKDFRFCVELPILAKRSQMKIQNMGSLERKILRGKKLMNLKMVF